MTLPGVIEILVNWNYKIITGKYQRKKKKVKYKFESNFSINFENPYFLAFWGKNIPIETHHLWVTLKTSISCSEHFCLVIRKPEYHTSQKHLLFFLWDDCGRFYGHLKIKVACKFWTFFGFCLEWRRNLAPKLALLFYRS